MNSRPEIWFCTACDCAHYQKPQRCAHCHGTAIITRSEWERDMRNAARVFVGKAKNAYLGLLK